MHTMHHTLRHLLLKANGGGTLIIGKMVAKDGLFTLLFAILIVNVQSCILLAKDNHGDMKVNGYGLHRELKLPAFIQTQSRIPQCRILYKIEIPEGVYVDERELQSARFGYDFIVLPVKKTNSQMLFAIKKKLYLSTFEMKNLLKIKIHLHPPSKAFPKSLKFPVPTIAVDCKGDLFKGCTTLKTSRDLRLKSESPNWLSVKSPSRAPVELETFRDEQLFADFGYESCFLLVTTLLTSMYYLIK
ncbi:Phosphatidylinositol-glycan biosynthesis class X protein [Caenorhabditis elegans]|uniref:Phosphatidylinositol-glycan biosynthesis class X protein n=1 Tax=Caenorhabditis elegans TaxID=6239 RepID=Q9GYH8_CAEEL|nr:Phosphatidylinositol-glycan biosynthesis class X protein [Caenorhabditis elegans]CCD63169.1 Phosphatidylinositol-glycan biosynthesis class X protein [Caenorhabditis elegans]|eukprot:NP_508207.1 Uncharacterized protein CELE_F49E7.2 [Caenorhabditis elegans]